MHENASEEGRKEGPDPSRIGIPQNGDWFRGREGQESLNAVGPKLLSNYVDGT